MDNIDLAYGDYSLPPNVIAVLKEMNAQRMSEHPVCERCNARASTRIAPVGPCRAWCDDCVAVVRAEIAEEIAADADAEW
jgi:ribosomal protein L40E